MIVKCPSCSLEQPLDEYCAGCGKKLNRLIKEEQQHRKEEDRKVAVFLSLALVTFVVCVFAYYKFSKEVQTQAVVADTGAQEVYRPRKVALKKTKINSENDQATSTAPVENAPLALKSTKASLKSAAETKFLEEDESKLAVPPKTPSKPLQIERLYFLNGESCPPEDLQVGALEEQSQIEGVLSCALVVFEENIEDGPFVFDEGSSFVLRLQTKSSAQSTDLNFALNTEQYTFNYSFSLTTSGMKPSAKGGLWSYQAPFSLGKNKPSEEMLASYTTSAALGLVPKGEKAFRSYILATFTAAP